MIDEDFEFLLSQYAAGTLPETKRVAVEVLLKEDAEARVMLADERALTNALRALPMPAVRWDALSDSISSAIDRQLQERVDRASWMLRWRVPKGLAIAASALLAIGIAITVVMHSSHTNPSHPFQVHPAPTPVLFVEGPQVDRPQGPVVTEISIAAGGSYAKDPSLSPYDDELDRRPSRVVIASGVASDRPRLGFPY
jgi:hypothetical protein